MQQDVRNRLFINSGLQWRASISQNQKDNVITVKKRGIKFGDGRVLTPAQEMEIQNTVKDKYPDQLKTGFALRTREAVRKLIEK
jgi:hypothetical protein